MRDEPVRSPAGSSYSEDIRLGVVEGVRKLPLGRATRCRFIGGLDVAQGRRSALFAPYSASVRNSTSKLFINHWGRKSDPLLEQIGTRLLHVSTRAGRFMILSVISVSLKQIDVSNPTLRTNHH
jgi:hypothetical protein